MITPPAYTEKALRNYLECGIFAHGVARSKWVLSFPKRLRHHLQRDKAALNAALRIFLRVVHQSLKCHCLGAATALGGANSWRIKLVTVDRRVF